MLSEIKGIILDWGGVLIDNPAGSVISYCSRVLAVPEQDFSSTFSNYEERFQKGLLSELEFWSAVCNDLAVSLPDDSSLWRRAFEAAYRQNEGVLHFVTNIRATGIKTAILSNTEQPAFEYFQTLKYECFDQEIFSCLEGTRKPESKIYELALKRLDISPSQAIFVDDKHENIQGAREAGLHALLFEDYSQLVSDIKQFGLGK
ncbi:hypothetical protein LCGC14_2118430 [marine sediment metagenome]|uniref:FCP1 homology domain-containing protein n=1 Tax=marine sediment metagenome TaxID=412755 RepID=A0A0F9ES22_9ZZZZ